MKKTLVLLCLLLPLPALAAKKPPAKKPAPAATPTPHATTKLTRADLEGAHGMVRPFQPWAAAYDQVVAKIGKPQNVDGQTSFWYAKDAGKCLEFSMENLNGDVGVVDLGEYDSTVPDKFALCDKY